MRAQNRARKQSHDRAEVLLVGRRRKKDVANSMMFLATIEGDRVDEAHIRSANGMRWRVA
jgi:hypothetical protein